MAMLIFLSLVWLMPAVIGIGLAHVTRRQCACADRDPAVRRPVLVVEQDASVPEFVAGLEPSPPVTAAWPALMSGQVWSALVLGRLQRLAAIAPATVDGVEFDAKDLIRRVTYSTYLDCRDLGLEDVARAILPQGSPAAGGQSSAAVRA